MIKVIFVLVLALVSLSGWAQILDDTPGSKFKCPLYDRENFQDYNITPGESAYYLIEYSRSASAIAKVIEPKLKNPQAKAFAKKMEKEHQALVSKIQSLSKQEGFTLTPTPQAHLVDKEKETLIDALNNQSAIDRYYLCSQIQRTYWVRDKIKNSFTKGAKTKPKYQEFLKSLNTKTLRGQGDEAQQVLDIVEARPPEKGQK